MNSPRNAPESTCGRPVSGVAGTLDGPIGSDDVLVPRRPPDEEADDDDDEAAAAAAARPRLGVVPRLLLSRGDDMVAEERTEVLASWSELPVRHVASAELAQPRRLDETRSLAVGISRKHRGRNTWFPWHP